MYESTPPPRVTLVSVPQNTRGSTLGRLGIRDTSVRKTVWRVNLRIFPENSRETVSVSTICDVYCSLRSGQKSALHAQHSLFWRYANFLALSLYGVFPVPLGQFISVTCPRRTCSVAVRVVPCLVPRPHYSARPKRFGSRGPIENVSRPFASDTSPKWIDREGLGKRRTGTRHV